MSSHDKHRAPGGPADVDRIAAELAALGEDALDELELPMLADGEADADVRTVGTLVSLATPLSPALVRPLSEIELARIYRRVAVRLPAAARKVVAHDDAAHAPAPSRRSILSTLSVVAAAAAFVLVPVLRSEPPSVDAVEHRQRALSAAEATGDAARAGLSRLGPSGGARATALAERYAARLHGGAGD